MKGRRSSQVQLVVLGTVLIGACSDENIPKDRYVYRAQQECVQDWGETNCEKAPASGGGGGYYYGPRFNTIVHTPGDRYLWSGNADRPAVNPVSGQAMGSKSVNVASARGGFGSSARSISSSGS